MPDSTYHVKRRGLFMIGPNHDAPSCADCLDTGRITDPRSADEDGCTPPVDERELEAEREAVELDEGERPPTPAAGKLAWPLQEEDIAW